MRYADIIDNDIVDGVNGISVSFWTQGCPFHCPGCHNPKTWDFKGGKELPINYINIILKKLMNNGIQRHLSILGGEPLCPENLQIVYNLCYVVRKELPITNIILWTGYTLQELKERAKIDIRLKFLLDNLTVIIDGPYKKELRDLRLKLRGSSNQIVWERFEKHFLWKKYSVWKKATWT